MAVLQNRIPRESREGIFVRAGTIDRRHGHIQQPEIDGKLSAMVIEVVHHDGANKANPRRGHEHLPVSVAVQMDMMRASSSLARVCLACAVLWVNASRISFLFCGSGCDILPISNESLLTASARKPWPRAICNPVGRASKTWRAASTRVYLPGCGRERAAWFWLPGQAPSESNRRLPWLLLWCFRELN